MKPQKLVYFFIFLLCLGLNIYLRLFPSDFPQLKKQARLNVERSILENTQGLVNRNFPDFNPLIKQKIFEKLFKERQQDKEALRRQFREDYLKLKDKYQDSSGQTYLLEVDPYSWMRSTRLVLKNGYPGDNKEDGKIFDTYMLAPRGAKVTRFSLLFYLSSFLYKISYLFFPGLNLEKFLFYLPVFFSAFFLSVLYLFCRYFFSEIVAVSAVFFTGLAPVFLARSSAGWFDSDVLNILFPLLVIWSFAAALKHKNIFKNLFFSLLSSFFLCLYALSWVGWWFIYIVVLGLFLYVFSNNLFLYSKDFQEFKRSITPYIISLSIFITGSIVLCFFIAGFEPVSYAVRTLFAHLGLGKSVYNSIWPSTYYTVEELKTGDFLSIPLKLGNWVLFVISVASLLIIYLKQKRGKNADIIILLMFWSFFMVFTSFRGIRFTLLLSVPFGIFAGVGIDMFSKFISKRLRLVKKVRTKSFVLVCIALFSYLLISFSVKVGFVVAKRSFPMINDSWYEFLLQIKSSTPEDSIINAWWDYGSWFKEIARRRVIFDGQSQNRPVAYWMARILLSRNEEQALSILRMLNNSSDSLIKDLRGFIGGEFRIVCLLEKLVESSSKEAEVILSDYDIPKALKDKIKQAVFYKKPQSAYFVIDRNMLFKMHEISFIGNWGFAKVYIMKNRNKAREEILDNLEEMFLLPRNKAEAYYNEVILSTSGEEINEVLSNRWKFYFGLSEGEEENGNVYFGNGIILRLSDLDARIFFSDEQKFKQFKYVFFVDGQNLIYREHKDADSDWGCVFFKSAVSGLTQEGTQANDLRNEAVSTQGQAEVLKQPSKEKWQCIGMSKDLGQSLFFKLYFMKGKTLKYFKPFIIDERSGLYAFKIDWPEPSQELE